MVCDTVKPSLRAASCWRVEVVNGGAGAFFTGRTLTCDTLNPEPEQAARKLRASVSSARRRESSAWTGAPSGAVKSAVTR